MKLDLAQTITILANLGVIAGIIFLAMEIGLNRASLDQANYLNELARDDLVLERNNAWTLAIAGDEQLSRIWFEGLADSELDPLEKKRFDMLCEQNFWNAVILDGGDGANAAVVRENIEGSSLVRDCWNSVKGRISYYGYDPFVQAVDSENSD